MATEQARRQSTSPTRAIVGVVIASLIGAAVFGAVLQATGRMDSLVALYGMTGVETGWVLVLGHSVLAVLGFAIVALVISPVRLAAAFGASSWLGTILAGLVLGIVYGVLVWAVVVAIGVPLWFETVIGAERPFPYLHEVSLVGLILFGAVIGASYSAFLGPGKRDEAAVDAARQ